MEGSWPSQGISRRGGLPTSCSGAPEYRKESSISSIFAVGPGHGGALASSSTFLWLSMHLVTWHMHILWGLLLKKCTRSYEWKIKSEALEGSASDHLKPKWLWLLCEFVSTAIAWVVLWDKPGENSGGFQFAEIRISYLSLGCFETRMEVEEI